MSFARKQRDRKTFKKQDKVALVDKSDKAIRKSTKQQMQAILYCEDLYKEDFV